MQNTLLHRYKNGNVNVEIYSDGTKIREWPDGEKPVSEYPESCDLKITQYCDMDAICVYCHEMSNKQGQHGDLDVIDSIWASQMPGTELAIGGGNPLAHPGLPDFLWKMKTRGIIPNVTANIMHMKKFAPMIRGLQADELIYGLGISYRGPKSLVLLPEDIDYSNVVFHMIMGIHDLNDCRAVIDWCVERNITPKILLLGYKTFGNGIHHYTDELKQTLGIWKNVYLRSLLQSQHRVVVSFDNLAISQLDLKAQVSDDVWSELFQGEDGNHTFYIDAVKQEVARTSTSDVRYTYSMGDDIRDLFSKVKVAA
jgi:hypothetical protein